MERLENHDATLTAQLRFNPTDVSITAQMAGIAAAKPDAIIVLASGTSAATVFTAASTASTTSPRLPSAVLAKTTSS
jgi:ABC-type branched-subunit amino acid transport system substrate-binding protein